MLIASQSVTGAVRNLIVVAVIGSAVAFSCSRWISFRTALVIAGLGVLASVQAFIPDFIIPIASFTVVLALLANNLYVGLFCLMLFSALPFLVTERSFEYLLFYMVTGLIATALIFGRRKMGRYTDVLIAYALTYILLFTGLVILKRSTLTPALIIGPIVGLVLNVVIMQIAGYEYYDIVIKAEEELLQDVVDPEYPLLLSLKKENKREFKRAIHTAHFTELFANRLGYDPVLMKGLGFYHRIGVLIENDMPLSERTVSIALDEGFPDNIIDGLSQYGAARPGEKISAEVSIVVIVDTVIVALMNEFSKETQEPDLNKFIDKTILKLFSGRDSMLKRSAIPYNDLEEIRKTLKSERIYYDFLR